VIREEFVYLAYFELSIFLATHVIELNHAYVIAKGGDDRAVR